MTTRAVVRSLAVTAAVLGAAATAGGSATTVDESVTSLEAATLQGVPARTAALLMSGQSGGAVEGAVLWTVTGADPGEGRVTIRVFAEVDGRGLLEGSPDAPVEVEVAAYLVDDQAGLREHFAAVAVLDRELVRQQVRNAGLRLVGEMSCPQGRLSLRVTVRNRATGRYLLARRELELELGAGGAPRLLPPQVEGVPGRWVTVVLPGVTAAEWPSARPLWRADRPLEMTVGGAAVTDGSTLVARLENHLGRTLVDSEIRLETGARFGPGGWFSRARVAAPDLPPGSYRLVLSALDADRGRVVEEWLPVVIHDREELQVWTDAAELAEPGPPPAGSEPPSPGDLELEAVQTAYRQALETWAEGDTVAARRALAELERPYALVADDRTWRKMVAAEGSVLSELAATRPGAVVAAVLLHRELYSWYLARGEGALARHSWESAAILALEAEDLDGFDPPEGFTEGVLLELASHLAESGQPDSARQLLESALDVAPDSERTLLALGVLAERSGRLGEALGPLQKLVEKHPEHAEGRLRLAVTRSRTGSDAEAEVLLRGLLGRTAEPWIRSLVYQELGRLLIRRDRLEEAIEVLLEGTAERPADQGLRVLLAHTLDRVRQPRKAVSVLADLETGRSADEESPRYRYSRWPELEAPWLRSVLSEAERVARDAFREAPP